MPLSMRVCWVSARPSSHGVPACLSELSGLAPVPPSWPETRMTSASAFVDARGDRADARLAHELDVHAGLGVGALEVEDELLEVFDRVDVVVRRRRDEPDAGGRVPGARDPRVDLGRRQLAALAGLGALRELDLDVGRRGSGTCSSRRTGRDATCLIALRRSGSSRRSTSSPPSPVFDLPPMRFIAIASVSCASLQIEP